MAEEVELWFVAGIARHTLVTSTARLAEDPAAVLSTFGPLIDHWHGFGSWTQLWMVVRALAETLSRLGRHHDATLLLGALAASPRASQVYGSDSRTDRRRRGRRPRGTRRRLRVLPGRGCRARRRRGRRPRPPAHPVRSAAVPGLSAPLDPFPYGR